jgi:hypothetical protein
MFNLLQVIDLGPGATEGSADELVQRLNAVGAKLPGVRNALAGKTLPRALNGGHLMWRIAFTSEADYWACVSSPAWRTEVAPQLSPERGAVVDSIAYQAELYQPCRSGEQVGIWRCLVMALEPGVEAAALRQFERDTLLMPPLVGTIRSWALGRVRQTQGRRAWSYVWEQEFADIGGLEGEYMTNPIHWGVVDGWFDVECPQRIFDPCLIHAAFEIPRPILAR